MSSSSDAKLIIGYRTEANEDGEDDLNIDELSNKLKCEYEYANEGYDTESVYFLVPKYETGHEFSKEKFLKIIEKAEQIKVRAEKEGILLGELIIQAHIFTC